MTHREMLPSGSASQKEVRDSEIQALFDHLRGSKLTDDQLTQVSRLLIRYECNLWEGKLPHAMHRSDFEELARLVSFTHTSSRCPDHETPTYGLGQGIRRYIQGLLPKQDISSASQMSDIHTRYPSDIVDILRRAMNSTDLVSDAEKQRVEEYRYEQLYKGAVAPPLPAQLCAKYRERSNDYLSAATRGNNILLGLYDDEALMEIRMILMISLHPIKWGDINKPPRAIVWSDRANTYRATGDQLEFLQEMDYVPAMPQSLYDRLSWLLSQGRR